MGDAVFVVTMYQYGIRDMHSFIHSVHVNDQETAVVSAQRFMSDPGNIYMPEITKHVDGESGYSVVIRLREHWSTKVIDNQHQQRLTYKNTPSHQISERSLDFYTSQQEV